MTIEGLAVGATWQGEYLLAATLGDPTHGVFRAQRRQDGQTVTVRLWRAGSDALANEFLESALAACGVRHRNIAQVEATGREHHYCYLVTEYVVGQKLDSWADQVGIPPLPEVVELMRRICEGLHAASESQLVHTALHPRNIVMLGEGPNDRRAQPKLLDLGVPTVARPVKPQTLGAQFMAPEQLAAALDPNTQVLPETTPAMNVYSCGALLYYLCTGGPPFRQVDLSALRQAHNEGRMALPSRINPQITSSLNSLIVRALSVDPKQRFADIGEVVEALAQVNLTVSATGVRPVPSFAPSLMPVGKKRPSGAFVRASVVPAITSRRAPLPPTEFEPEGDTAKTGPGRLSPVSRPPTPWTGAAIVKASEVIEERGERISAPPAGSFSSPPPSQSSKPPAPVVATPVALFSNSPNVRVEPALIVTRVDSTGGPLLTAHEVITSRPPRPRARPATRYGLMYGSLAVIACVGTFGVVRLVRTPEAPATSQARTPLVTVENAATQPAVSNTTGSYAAPIPTLPPVPAPAAAEPAPSPPPATAATPSSPADSFDWRATRGRNLRAMPAPNGRPEPRTPGAAHPPSPPREAAPEPAPEPAPVPVAREPPPPVPAPDVLPPIDESALHLKPLPRTSEPEPDPELRPAVKAPARVAVNPAAPARSERLEARAAIGEIQLRGSMPTSMIRRAIERIRPQLTACYARAAAAAGRNSFGTLDVDLEIDERGRVRKPRARGSALPGLNDCVAEAAGKVISEPPDTGTVHASFQVTFSP
jgi:serine/threonine protein kinase